MSTNKSDQEPSMEEILSSIRRIIADEQDEGAAVSPAEGARDAAHAPQPADADDDDDDVLDLTQPVDTPETEAPAAEAERPLFKPRSEAEEPAAEKPADEALDLDQDEIGFDDEPADDDDATLEEPAFEAANADDDGSAVADDEDEAAVDTGPDETTAETPDDAADLEPVQPPPEPALPPQPTKGKTHVSASPQQDTEFLSSDTTSRSTSAFARLAKAASGEDRRPVADGERTVEAFMVDLLKPMLKEWLDQNLQTIVERVVEQEVKKLARRAELL